MTLSNHFQSARERKHIPITPDTQQAMVKDALTGATLKDLSIRYSLSCYIINKMLGKQGIVCKSSSPKPKVMNAALVKKVKEEIKAGATITLLSIKYGLFQSSISRMLAQEGINYRELRKNRRDQIRQEWSKYKNQHTPVTGEQAEAIVQSICSGISRLNTALTLGVSEDAVRKILQQRGIDYRQLRQELLSAGKICRRYVKPDGEVKNKVLEEIRAGEKKEAVARKYHLPTAVISRILAKAGINYQQVQGDQKASFYSMKYRNAIFKGQLTANKEQLLQELREMAVSLGHIPSRKEIGTGSKFGLKQYQLVFGSVLRALKEESFIKYVKALPGFLPQKPELSPEQKEQIRQTLIAHLRQKTRLQGYAPNREEMYSDKVYNYSRYYQIFGSFEKALKMAELKGMQQTDKKARLKIVAGMRKGIETVKKTIRENPFEEQTTGKSFFLIHSITDDLNKLEDLLENAKYAVPEV